MRASDTICAVASGAPPSAIAIVRISGPLVRDIGQSLLPGGLPAPRQAVLSDVRDKTGQLIDRGLAVFFPAPHSYTGEDTLELFVHGGAAVIAHALGALIAFPGVRLAEPGEFTRRAFENGKVDLTQAEGIADLIEAETEAQKRQALRQVSGELGAIYDDWREQLVGLLALVEVMVDFPDEGDTPQTTMAPLTAQLDRLRSAISAALGDGGVGEKIRDGFRVAIIGAPNAGKSTLLNRIAGRQAAIVTAKPGTTRDVIEVRRTLGGQVVWFADTAGLRDTDDEIEAEGVRRARQVAAAADLRLHVIDASATATPLPSPGRADLIVWNKIDHPAARPSPEGAFPISAAAGDGMADLERAISGFVHDLATGVEAPVITRTRHRQKLADGLAALDSARQALLAGLGFEIVAEDLRRSIRLLAGVVGQVDVEDVLGGVFSRFCIGK